MATLPCGGPLTAVLEEGPALLWLQKNCSPKSPLTDPWPLRTQPSCKSSPTGCIKQRTGPPRPVHAKPLACKGRRFYGQSQILAGRRPRVDLRGLGEWEQYLPGPVLPQPVGTELPQGNQANTAEGGRPGGWAHPQFPKSQPQQEGPACPTSWQVASTGPPASPHGDGQESHGQAGALEKGTWASKA